jgi:Ricin-type beta-trefoil lectin domain
LDESTSLHAVIDIVGYGQRDFRQQDESQKHLVEFVKVSLHEARAGRVRTGPRGDALTLTFPDGRNVSEVLAVIPRRLSYELNAFNRGKMPDARMRVRLSFAMGPSVPGPLGEVGSAPVVVARLNNASALRKAMKAEPNAYLGVCIDDYLYFQHVAQASRPDLEPDEYYQVDVSDHEKDFKARAWIRLVGHQPRFPGSDGLPPFSGPRRRPPRQSALPVPRSLAAALAERLGRSVAAGTIGGDSDRRRRRHIRLTTAWVTLIVGVITAAVTLSVYPADGAGARQQGPSEHGPTSAPASGQSTEPSASGLPASAASQPAVVSSTPTMTMQTPGTFPSGFVSWHNLNTGDCLDSTGVGHVFTDACNGGHSQMWFGQWVSGAIYVLQNEWTGYCLTSTQTGIYSAACTSSDPQQQWRVDESDSFTPFVHVSDGSGSCLADPAPDHLATVECDGSAYNVDNVGSVDRRDQYWNAG